MKIKLHIYILFLFLFLTVFSFANTDSSKTAIYYWKLLDNGEIVKLDVDSSLYNFQIFNSVHKNSISSAFLNPIGAIYFSNVLETKSDFDLNYLKQREVFLFNHSNRKYYNTKTPFTEIKFFTGLQDQNLHVFHTQNINPFFNIGVEYNLISSAGFYKNQKNKNHSISLFLDYISPKYDIYITYSTNKYLQSENGGLKIDTSLSAIDINPAYSEVNLQNAQSESKYSNLYLGQEFKFGKKKDSLSTSPFRLFHSLSYTSTYRKYDDDDHLSGFYLGEFTDSIRLDSIGVINDTLIYDSVLVSYVDSNSVPLYFDSIATHDSIFNREITNIFLLKTNFTKLFQANIGFSNELLLYSFINKDSLIIFDDTTKVVYNHYTDTVFNSSSFIIEFYNYKNAKINWNLGAQYYFKGYKESNINIDLGFKSFFNVNKPEKISYISLDANFSRKNPNFFENNYHSNHYIWDSSFVNKDITRIKLLYKKPSWRMIFGISSFIFDNYIYYDEMSLPRQTTSTFSVYSAFIKKSFSFHHVNFNNEIVYQSNENEYVLRIPSLIYKNSTYVDFKMFNKVLDINLGFDFYYTSDFYSYGYNPATSVFYLQNKVKTGNYPLVDLFVVAKLKRARLFAKLSHANYKLNNNETLYTLNKYPIYGRVLYFGLSWSFYD